MDTVQDSHLIFGAIFCLFFGIIFSILVRRARRLGRLEGYTWAYVSVGVFVVLLVFGAIYGLEFFLGGLLLYAMAGIPMVYEYQEWFWGAQERSRKRKG